MKEVKMNKGVCNFYKDGKLMFSMFEDKVYDLVSMKIALDNYD